MFGAMIGMAGALAATGAAIGLLHLLNPSSSAVAVGDKIMGESLLITAFGLPWSFLAIWLAESVGTGSPLFLVSYLLQFVCILINGALVGYLIARLRKGKRDAPA